MDFIVEFEASQNIVKATNKELAEAWDIIEKDAPTYIEGNVSSRKLEERKLVRLDLQGQFNKSGGKRYANLQIQLNKPRYSNDELAEESEESKETQIKKEVTELEKLQGNTGNEEGEGAEAMGKLKSTTIATVLMPCNEHIPKSISIQAFNGSLSEQKKAIIMKKQ